MSFALNIQLTDAATPALRSLAANLAGRGPKEHAGAGVVELLRDNFFTLESRGNKQGWPSTHFWRGAADATTSTADPDGVYIAVDWAGVRQRWQGGTITAKDRMLTFAAAPESYGRRASDMGDLSTGRGVNPVTGRNQLALVNTEGTHPYMDRGGETKEAEGTVMFWLARKAVQVADPEVIPSEERILGAAISAVDEYLSALNDRGGHSS